MATYTRNNAWNQNGTFNNTDLLWYAKGVGVMQSRQLDDHTSWWFFAAIHSYYFNQYHALPDWNFITESPKVPAAPMPGAKVIKKYWEQCQHQNWYFPPWHRGYLIALEKQIRAAIAPLGGPQGWSLPYWNYFGPNNEHTMPPAFALEKLPDGSPNPLYVKRRFGPRNDGNIFVADPDINQKMQQNTIFTGKDAATKLPGYGGTKTGFQSSGHIQGNLERNPHNGVHTAIGGGVSENDQGLMSDPGTAALDPIFYLHHCNIDRMWASWNAAGNPNPIDPDWLKGPTAVADRKFVMPLPDSSDWNYTPKDVNSLSQLDYDYQNLDTGITHPLVSALSLRLSKFGLNTFELKDKLPMDNDTNPELVGANSGPLEVKTSGARASVNFDPGAWEKVPISLMSASLEAVPDRVFLQLENVRGAMDANKLTVMVNQRNAGSVFLFGLRKASEKTGHHGGAGLTFPIDITNIIDKLHLNNALSSESLDVMIVPATPLPEAESITIGRIGLYREPQS